jgi:hypothetical protein
VTAHLTPAALAKAKAIGVVAAALTAGGAGGMVALSQVSDTGPATPVVISADATSAPDGETSQAPTVSPTPTATQSTTAAAVPTATAYALPSCPADVKNHGGYVASVATTAPKGSAGARGEHGGWVSQAARSDCGKDSAGDGQDAPEADGSETPKAERTRSQHSKSSTTQTTTTQTSDGQSSDGESSGGHGSSDAHGDH